jgi:two-component system CheB/CheR fusion protein
MTKAKAATKPGSARAKSSVRRRAHDGEETSGLRPGLPFPVVAIGASAGGLAAFTELLKALPPKSGMAFVLIQHLEPRHESALTTLLSKTTSMPVVEVSEGMAVEPNRVYVIPPNRDMTIRKGTLRLAPRSAGSGMQRPIDDFSIALAEEQGDAAIGVVLSGTGSDGTYGLKAIKAAGGVTFAQDPKTAQWPAMPMSAITAGSVDFVLPPKRIAAELARIGRHPWLAQVSEVPEGSDLDKACMILRSATGIDFRLYKQATVRRRMARRMALRKIASLSKYAQILRQNPEEAQALADDIFIHVTSFFRDPECFQALRKQVLSKLSLKRTAEEPIRIWVAGCSTGEEVYSLAMLLLEELGERASRIKIQIFGTDIQERALERARAGIYTDAAVAEVTAARLKRFFVKSDHGWQIQKAVRNLCVFARHDLARDPPFSRLDLISCRNVLIYMGPALQKRLLSIFQYALKPGGFLFLGNSESVSDYSDAFTAEDLKHRIFLRKLAPTAFRDYPSATNSRHGPNAVSATSSAASPGVDFRKEAEEALLERFTPPALVVDPDLHIVHFQGDLSRYLVPATGQPSFHLLKMVRPELLVDLRTAIYKARKEHINVHKDDVQFPYEGRRAAVRLEVEPLRGRNGKKQDLLVVFQKV